MWCWRIFQIYLSTATEEYTGTGTAMTNAEKKRLITEEAYASAPQNEIVLHSMEVNHKTFTEPFRVIRWPIAGEEPVRFQCLLEEDADYNPNEIVEFIGAPFELMLPEKDTENPGQFTVRIDNIGDLLDEYLENAALSGGKISAVYREYIKGQEKDGPASVWPGITLTSPRMENQTLFMDGAILSWMSKKWGGVYTPGKYPGIMLGR
jgi:hypothetical protein